jgi:hypothetical protein
MLLAVEADAGFISQLAHMRQLHPERAEPCLCRRRSLPRFPIRPVRVRGYRLDG